LLGKLIGKMRRALALTHLDDTDHGPQMNDRLILRGAVDGDPQEDHRVPIVGIGSRSDISGFVAMKGGEYFFAPAVSTLKQMPS